MEICGVICGTGGGNLPLPGDPSDSLLLQATSAFGGINLRWPLPIQNAHAVSFTRIYRGPNNDFSLAQEIAIISGNTYFDAIYTTEKIPYYYWIRHVSIQGTEGGLVGPAWAYVGIYIDQVMEDITGRILDSALGQALRTKIDKIDWLEDGLTQEATYRANDDEAVATAYQGLQATLDQATALILQEQEARATADSALASFTTTVQSQLGNEIASVEQNMETYIDYNDNRVGAIYTVKLDVNGLIGGFGLVNDSASIQAWFNVDTFAVGRGTSKAFPFIIDGGQTYISSAVIKDASITNAKIGGDLYSKNWTGWGGSSGWYIAQDGNAYFNNANLRGTLHAVNGTFSGTLTAQAINAVDTINIAGNAVSSTLVFQGDGTAPINVPSTTTAIVFVTSYIHGNVNNNTAYGLVHLNGSFIESPVLVYASGSTGGDGDFNTYDITSITRMAAITIPAGTSTLYFGRVSMPTVGAPNNDMMSVTCAVLLLKR